MNDGYELPAGWITAPISEVLAPQSDGKVIHQGWSPLCEKFRCNTSEEWGVLKTTSIQAGEFQPEHHKQLPQHLMPRPSIEVSEGDLLLTCAGPRIRCGVACLVRSTRPRLLLSGKMYRFRAIPNVTDERYLEAFLQTDAAQAAIDLMKTGGNESGLNLTHERFKQLQVRVAPYTEQIRIVEKLEELLSDLDAGVAELKTAQRKLAQYRQSLLKAAVEGALTADWREARAQLGEPQETGTELLERILIERRTRWETKQLAKFAEQGKTTPPKDWKAKYPATPVADTSGLPKIPATWTWASLGQLVSDSSYGTSVKCSHEANGDAVLRIPNVIARSIDLSDLKFATQSLQLAEQDYLSTGDILIVRTNGSISLVGRAAEVPPAPSRRLYFASYLVRVRCTETAISPRWISALLASNFGRQWIEKRAASSAGQHNISLSTLLTIPVPLPPLEEQIQALESLELATVNVNAQALSLEFSLRQSSAQRKNILRSAFAGQLVPQDPQDEPANALLDRIRAERGAAGETSSKRTRTPRKTA